ncbi:MAG: Uridine nucleosidase 1 [Geoglossum simile]|nr:MAG: Uridine nucleosidase 1 [Geoglossum simile]
MSTKARDRVYASMLGRLLNISFLGTSGLDGTNLLPPPLHPPNPQNAILAARDALLATQQHTAWVVATGALTNIALLFATFPEVGAWIKGLSIMGGAIGGGFTNAPMGRVDGKERVGNRTNCAEFNINCDPESAQSIFSNPLLARKTTLITLDLTHLVLATPPVLDTLLRGPSDTITDTNAEVPPPSNLRQLLHDLLTFFATAYAQVFDLTAGPPLHDPLAVAAIISPSVDDFGFDDRGGERFVVEVVTGSGDQAGMTVVRAVRDGEDGVRIPRAVDVVRFWDCVEECVRRAEEAVGGLRVTGRQTTDL